MILDRFIPILTIVSAAILAALRADWPSTLGFITALILYGSMRLLERRRENEIGTLALEVQELRVRVSDLAMRSGSGSGIL